MATIAIPLVTAALGSLGPLIAKAASGLINVAEAYLPKGTKLDAVLAGVEAFLAPLGTSGAIQQTVPTTTQLSSTIEGVLAKMKADGTLVPALSGLSTTPAAASPAAIGSGQTVNLPIKISFGV
jgi:hypothetical protein